MPVDRRAGTVVLRLTGSFLLAVALVAVVAPRPPNIHYARLPLLACLVLGAGVLALGALVVPKVRDGGGASVVALTVTLLGSAASTLLAFALRYDFGWDARVVAGMAQRLAETGDLSAYQYGYLSRYPNNLPLLVIDNLAHSLGSAVHLAPATVFVLFNGVCLAVTLQATYWLVAMLRGRAYGVVAQLLVLALVGLSPWMSVSYTDLVAMPCVVLATALVVAVPRTRGRPQQAAFVLLAVALLLVGFVVKTTPVVSLVAVGLVVALALVSRPGVRRPVGVGLLAGVVLFLGGTIVARHATPAMAGVSAERIDRSRTPPTTWWLYMATRQHAVDGRMRYGGYDADMVRATSSLDATDSGDWARPRLEAHLSDLGVGGYLAFLTNKAVWNWGDGLFFAWGEGHDAAEPRLVHGSWADTVAVWNRPDGAAYPWRAAAAEAVWLLVLMVAGARLLRTRWTWELTLLALSLLGIATFTLLFQGRSRYLLAYVPVVVALAVALPAVHAPGWLAFRLRGRVGPLRRDGDD
jgi:hypothetical protein